MIWLLLVSLSLGSDFDSNDSDGNWLDTNVWFEPWTPSWTEDRGTGEDAESWFSEWLRNSFDDESESEFWERKIEETREHEKKKRESIFELGDNDLEDKLRGPGADIDAAEIDEHGNEVDNEF